ncbi:MAG: hypothetical protein Q7S21_00900 [archaeon]|nr:hypothetical protein [archaeon]
MTKLKMLSEEDSKVIFESANKVAQFIHDNHIQNVIVLGYSGQIGVYAIKLAWKRLYPKTPLPHFDAIGDFASRVNYKRWLGEKEKIMSDLKKQRSTIFSLQRKNQSTLLFDVFARTGETMQLFSRIFQEEGFANIHTGLMFQSDYSNQIGQKFDIVGNVGEPRKLDNIRTYWKHLLDNPIYEKGVRAPLRVLSRERLFNGANYIRSDLQKIFVRTKSKRRRPV